MKRYDNTNKAVTLDTADFTQYNGESNKLKTNPYFHQSRITRF